MSGGITPPKKIKKEGHGDVVCELKIVQFADGYVEARNIPASLDMAKGMLHAADRAICAMFIRLAKENRLNEHNVIDGGRVVVPKPGLFGPN
jgi:hypothetical protein